MVVETTAELRGQKARCFLKAEGSVCTKGVRNPQLQSHKVSTGGSNKFHFVLVTKMFIAYCHSINAPGVQCLEIPSELLVCCQSLFLVSPCCFFVNVISVGEVMSWKANQHFVNKTS